LRNVVPASLTVKLLQRGALGSETTRTLVYEELQRGSMLLNYIGHGSVQQWAGDVLSADGVRWLSSNRLTVGLLMTCLNGFFQDPTAEGLAEALLETPAGGAAAVWASTGLTMMVPQSVMHQELIRRLFGTDEAPRLGDALRAAKAATDDPDVRATWVLLGDPTMRVH